MYMYCRMDKLEQTLSWHTRDYATNLSKLNWLLCGAAFSLVRQGFLWLMISVRRYPLFLWQLLIILRKIKQTNNHPKTLICQACSPQIFNVACAGRDEVIERLIQKRSYSFQFTEYTINELRLSIAADTNRIIVHNQNHA